MLEDGEMVRLTIRFRMGPGGQRDATLVIVLPLDKETRLHPEGAMTVAGAKLPVSPAPAAAKPAATLAAVVQQTPVAVIGILCRRKVSLQTLRNLVPGALLQLPHNVLDDARIETPGPAVGPRPPGEAEGLHAIRLRDVAQETAAARPEPAPWPTSTLAPGDVPVTRNPEPPMQDVHEADPSAAPVPVRVPAKPPRPSALPASRCGSPAGRRTRRRTEARAGDFATIRPVPAWPRTAKTAPRPDSA